MPAMSTSPFARLGLALALALAACRMDAPDPPTSAHATSGPAADAAQVVIGEIRWYVDMDAARAVARQTGKALWVHFGENPG